MNSLTCCPHAGSSKPRWSFGTRRIGLAAAALLLVAACSDVGPVAPSAELAPRGGNRWTVDGSDPESGNAVILWNVTALDAVSNGTLGPPMVARALATVHTAMFDAWAAYDAQAVGTRLGGSLRRPSDERTMENKVTAISYAAYRTLVDLYPAQVARFDARMASLGLDPANTSTDVSTAAGIGNVVAAAEVAFRHADGSNQLGQLGMSGVPYSDYTGYVPVNTPDLINDPNRWQPQRYVNIAGVTVTPTFLGAHWRNVKPFALTSAQQFRPAPPKMFPHGSYRQQTEEVIRASANLTDREKVIAEYWADGPRTVLPPGHFNLFGQFISERDGHTLDQDVQMFFALTNAIHDGAIAAWEAKRHYDYVRPITAVHYLKAGTRIRAWMGPGLGTGTLDGAGWRPFQPTWFPTPPFPEYVSGHSTFSAAGAEILARFTGSDAFGASVTVGAGSLVIESSVPQQPVTLSWGTFSQAADEAGRSRIYGGIHFNDGDIEGRKLGRLVATNAWNKAQTYINGSATP
jgi:hypothetical protein